MANELGMGTPFAHTLRSIEVEASSVGSRMLMGLTLVLLAGWAAWLMLADVEALVVSGRDQARVVAPRRELTATRSGRVVAVRAALGERVDAGAVLVELDDGRTRLALAQARRHSAAIDEVIARHEREITAEHDALEALARASGAAASEARARVAAAVADARLADSELAEAHALEDGAFLSEAELRRSQAQAERTSATTRALRSAAVREGFEQDRDVRDRLAEIIAIEGKIAMLAIDRNDATSRIHALEAELEEHRVRASVGGVVGELAAIERGSWIDAGETLGAIVPPGELEVVARFEPSRAVGRIKPGQPAQLRLASFPWAEYGSVSARVAAVASEPRDGTILVELDIEAVPPALELEHGLVGSIEILVEHTSPASLLLRAAGQRPSAADELEVSP
jgi:multidrug resistance efflux pump